MVKAMYVFQEYSLGQLLHITYTSITCFQLSKCNMFWTSPARPVSQGSSCHCRQLDLGGGSCLPFSCRTGGSTQNFRSFQRTVVLSPDTTILLRSSGYEKGASLIAFTLNFGYYLSPHKLFGPYQRILTIWLQHWSRLPKSLGHCNSDESLPYPVLLLCQTWQRKKGYPKVMVTKVMVCYKNLRMCVGMLRSLITSAFVPTTSKGIWT